jgi:hypothetical protein
MNQEIVTKIVNQIASTETVITVLTAAVEAGVVTRQEADIIADKMGVTLA